MPANRRTHAGRVVRTVAMAVRIDEQLVLEMKALSVDPRTGRHRYGSWNRTVEAIFRRWVDEQKATQVQQP